MYNYSLTRKQIQRLEEKYYVLLPDNSKISNSKVQDVIETQTNDPQLDQQTNSDYCDVKNSFNACQSFFLERFKFAMIGIIAIFFLRVVNVLYKYDKSKFDIFSLVALISRYYRRRAESQMLYNIVICDCTIIIQQFSYSFLIISIKSLQVREDRQEQVIKMHNITSLIALIFIIFCNICTFLSTNQDSQKILVLSCFLATDVLIHNWAYLEQRYSKRLIKLLMKIKTHL